MSSVSIIIPVYNALEFARQCLESVYRAASRTPFEVIVVDNGSSADVVAWLASERQRRARLNVLRYDRPLGFSRAVNAGARIARHDYLVILNSDCAVTDGWLDDLTGVMESDAGIGIASPVSNYSGPGSQLVSARPAAHAPLIEEARRLFFFCVMIRRELWDSLNGLDEIYQVGTYEDDDFCLRARAAGWRLVVAPGVFVFNHPSRTFEDNQIDRDEWLYRNETIFLERASSLSRSTAASAGKKRSVPSTTVIVAVPSGQAARLTDSLNSLANQTITGFETVIVTSQSEELPSIPIELERDLRIRRITVQGNAPGSLWNAGTAAAQGAFLAYLPAGDIYFPYHLEVLHRALSASQCQAAYSGWSVAIHSAKGTRHAPVRESDAQPECLLLGAWAPLACWIHERSSLPQGGFREDLHSFTEWDFTLRLSRQTKVWFEPAVTCERNRWKEETNQSVDEARLVMDAFPIPEPAAGNRHEFLQAVSDGAWEETLIVARREHEQRVRRVRRLLLRDSGEPADVRAIREAGQRLAAVNATLEPSASASRPVDFVFLNILRWTDLTQRPHHFAHGLASRGYRVFWIDVAFIPPERFTGKVAPRKLAGNIFEVQLPGFHGDIYRLSWTPALLELTTDAFRQLQKVEAIGTAVQFVNFPAWSPLAQRLRETFGWPIIYDCLDDQHAFSDLYGHRASSYEAELSQTSDILVTSGDTLYQAKLSQKKDALLIRNAADYRVFHEAPSQGLLDHLPRPVIGFFGAFADWLDLDWIDGAARRFPACSFVYIGCEGFANEESRLRWRSATSAPNVRVLPQADLAKLAAYLAQFDVCTMPFQDLPITRSMHAVKIYEYLAAGKHVLVPALPEMRQFAEEGLLLTYDDREQSFELLERLASQPPTREEILTRTAFAARNDWGERLDRLIGAAARLVPESEA